MDRRTADSEMDGAPKAPPGDGAGEAARCFSLCERLLRSAHPFASDVLQRCLVEHAGYAEGWHQLGSTLVELRQVEAAFVCLEHARRAAPGRDLALRIGVLLRDIGRLAEARACFAEAASRDPASVRARFLLGVAAQDAGDAPGAVAAYEAALALDPSLGEAALNLGTALQTMGDLDGARAAYGRAARLRPDGFARAAQALTTESTGELWLDLAALRRTLDGA